MKEFLLNKPFLMGMINAGGTFAAFLAWINLVSPIIVILSALIGLIAGWFLMVHRYHVWKTEKVGLVYRLFSKVLRWK